MKKITVCFLIAVFWSLPAFAGELYVKGVKANIMEKPSFKAKVLAKAARGEILQEIERKGKWVKVGYKGKSGWISTLVVSSAPSMARVSLLAGGKSLEKNARRRASAFTSVAAARGLTDYDRTRRGKDFTVDYDALKWMEKFEIEEAEALAFIASGVSK